MRIAWGLIGLGMLLPAACKAQTYPTLASGVLEYFSIDDPATRGFSYDLAWGEANVRLSPNVNLVTSFVDWGGYGKSDLAFDEAYGRYDLGDLSFRVGRFLTAFGFTDWSDRMYNGINWTPLVLDSPLGGGRSAVNHDAGVEATYVKGDVQVQASAVDSNLAGDQISPKKLNYGTLRVQESIGNALLAEDFLGDTGGSDAMYGADLRWTWPHLEVWSEVLKGAGTESDWGYFVQGMYRLPKLDRTQLVARTEELDTDEYGTTQIHTVGIRQVFNRYLTANLNYGWGAGIPYDSYDAARVGWSLRTMLMVRF